MIAPALNTRLVKAALGAVLNIVLTASLVLLPRTAVSQRDVQVCVVQEGRITTVTASYNTQTGDTTVAGQALATAFPGSSGYAAAATWFINNEPVDFAGRRYVKYGLPRILAPNEISPAGMIHDVPVFAETGVSGTPEVLYLPLRPGCVFQPYQAEVFSTAEPVLRAFQPWPPPAPSKRLSITNEIRQFQPRYYRDVANLLESAFRRGGYDGLSYYAVPGGFAVVTSFEQTYPDATPLPPPNRWLTEVLPPQISGLSSLLNAVFTKPAGYYRIAVITVTNQPFHTPVQTLTRSEAGNWLNAGLNALPASVAGRSFSNTHQVTVLIYEFERANPNASMILRLPGRWGVQHHLTKAGVWSHLVH